jgi:hypothetical protein
MVSGERREAVMSKRIDCRAVAIQRTLALALLAAAMALPGPASADDRNLVESGLQTPYVFILLDVSGSMHQTVTCSPADLASGFCNQECDLGDCLGRKSGDDLESKIAVAKQSIYNIMQTTHNVNFGFGTFDQAGLHMIYKYWYYSPDPVQPAGFITLADGTQYPAVGQQEVFGQAFWPCTDAVGSNGQNNALRYIGCGGNVVAGNYNNVINPPQPAHLDDTWENDRVRRYPKLNDANNSTWFYYVTQKSDNSLPVYRVTFTPVAPGGGYTQILGDARIQVKMTVDKCRDANCTTTNVLNMGTKTMVWDRVIDEKTCSDNNRSCNSDADCTGTGAHCVGGVPNEFFYWEPGEGVTKAPSDNGATGGGAYYGFNARAVVSSANGGNLSYMDTNFDANDCYTGGFVANFNCANGQNGLNARLPTTADPFGRAPANLWSQGDMIPLDWKDPHNTIISQRMAPNLLGGATTPDFHIASYYLDHKVLAEGALRLKDTTQRPFAPEGGTPTGGAMQALLDYLSTTNAGNGFFPGFCQKASDPVNGDANFNCRNTYMLLITDGLASDGSASCNVATALRTMTFKDYKGTTVNYPVRSYVIGMGLTSGDLNAAGYTNTLTCVADNGGTGLNDTGAPANLTAHYFNDYTNPGDPNATPPVLPIPPNPATATPCSATAPCDGPGPILPQNQQELVGAITQILRLVTTQSSAFSAAAVPSVQSDVQNKVVLSTFLPVTGPIWPGSIQAYLAPVPVKPKSVVLPDGTTVTRDLPDPTQTCPGPKPPAGSVACLVWDAAVQLLTQAATKAQILADDYNLDSNGNDGGKRRVFYSVANPKFVTVLPTLPNERDFLTVPADTAHWTDLLYGMGICAAGDLVCGANAANQALGKQTLEFFHEQKQYKDSSNNTHSFILGDVFHSDPQVVGNPDNFLYFSKDINGPANGYSTFARQHRFRRKVLYVGSDDGALHAFDIGLPYLATIANRRTWVFDEGTGNEIFAYVPRMVLPTLKNQGVATKAGNASQTFMVDGTVGTGDVFIQPNVTATVPTTPQWRTVVIGGLREGGRGYYALDVTQPDTLTPQLEAPDDSTSIAASIPAPNSAYVPSCTLGGSGCGPVPYPTPLWEFADDCPVVPTCTGPNCVLQACDEDANGQPDLGDTWSTPRIGRILVCDGSNCNPAQTPNNLVDKWVAIFGGGNDPNRNNARGNFLYMVDIQTGQVLYKRQMQGSVPSDVAAADLNQDGYIDTLYVGTTQGFMYKVDISAPAKLITYAGLIGKRVDTTAWIPFKVFDTHDPSDAAGKNIRPIYFQPAVVFDAAAGRYALAFGTGDRQDLWATTGTGSATGRFYYILDTGWTSTPTSPFTPLTVASFQEILPDATAQAPGTNFVDNPPNGLKNGWWMEFAASERVINKAFVLGGVVIFSAFQPVTTVISPTGKHICSYTGNSRLFAVNATQGNGLLFDTSGNSVRYNFTAQYTLGSKVVATPSPRAPVTGPNAGILPKNVDQLNANLIKIENQLKTLLPSNCRFSDYTINIHASRSDTGVDFIAPVPVCIIQQNWKEF